MKYYVKHTMIQDGWLYYIVDENGKQIGLTLPEACESVEAGKAFLGWMQKNWSTPSIDYTRITPRTFHAYFTEFLNQREEAEPVCDKCGGALGWAVDQNLGRCRWCRKNKPEQSAEPEASGDEEYHVTGYYPLGNPSRKAKFKIEHIESSNLVPLTFESRADAEGFLRWWDKQIEEWDYRGLIHEQKLSFLVEEYARHKAETAEVEYRCRDCEKATVKISSYEDALFLRCHQCGAQSSTYYEGSSPPKQWIHREGSV